MDTLDSAVSFYLAYRNFTTIATLAALGTVALLFSAVASGSVKPTPTVGDAPEAN